MVSTLGLQAEANADLLGRAMLLTQISQKFPLLMESSQSKITKQTRTQCAVNRPLFKPNAELGPSFTTSGQDFENCW